jgi:integrase
VDFYVKRHPIGLPPKTVREVVDELVESKRKSGKSDIYIREMTRRLGKFADAFVEHRLSTLTGKQIEDHVRGSGGVGRTQNNVRQLLKTLFKFAIKRGYLPKDHDEMSAVEKASVDDNEIEVFTPDELRKLFVACVTPVQERGKWRTREDMIPYLAIGAFCGLCAAEIERLDWSEVHLTGPERFIEVKASKAKTASRRTVPISDNCAAWLARFAQPSGPIVTLARTDKQLFLYLANKSGVPWKHNGLRHSYISYRLALIKDVGQVSLEAGNSPQMVFKHYRQLVRESEANDWFAIVPPKQDGADIIPMPTTLAKAETLAGPRTETAPFAAAAADAR